MNVQDLINIRKTLERIWSNDTVYSSSKEVLASLRYPRSKGQCYITALLIKFLYGGEILRGKINCGTHDEVHYWNKIGDIEIDFTGDQYGGDGYYPIITGKVVKRINWNNKRFKLLLNRWKEEVGKS